MKILVIPHHPGLIKVKIRLIEIAHALSKKHEVSLLNWNAAEERYGTKERARACLKDLFKRTKEYGFRKLSVIEIPMLHRPYSLVQPFNSFFLKKIIRRYKFDLVINGAYYFFAVDNKKGDFKYIFDLADIPVVNTVDPVERFVGKKTKQEVLKADVVTVISHGMIDYVSDEYGRKACFIPNGADLGGMRSCTEHEIAALRKRYSVESKWVIGYVGYIGSWVNVDMAVKSFEKVRKAVPEAVLMWVGAAPDLDGLKRKYSSGHIIFTGGVDEKIETYFRMFDLGIVPHAECLFQDMAFHLKVVELTAARKFIVSTRLKETQLLKFPNVVLVPESEHEWVEAILKAKELKWQQDWNGLAQPYDWQNIAENMMKLIC